MAIGERGAFGGRQIIAGPERSAGTFYGTSGRDHLTGTDDTDFFNLTQGGADIVEGLAGRDEFYFADSFDTKDQVRGGRDYDSLNLRGDYSAGVIFGAKTMTGVEAIYLDEGFSYNLTLAETTVRAGDLLYIRPANVWSRVTGMRIDGSLVAGDLSFVASRGDDLLIGGSGADYFKVQPGGRDVFDGGEGRDIVEFGFADRGVTVDLQISGTVQTTGFVAISLSNFESVVGSDFGDRLTGNAADNWLTSAYGDDRLSGLEGDDYLQVGYGLSNGDRARVTLSGGAGTDSVDFNANGMARSAVVIDLNDVGAQSKGYDTYILEGVENLSGTVFADRLTGDSGANSLFGRSGADELAGGGGNDRLYGDAYLDHTHTNGLNDGPIVIEPNAAVSYADVIDGGTGNDWIDGGGGNDTIIGGLGSDRLIGGAGSDTFVFAKLEDSKSARPDILLDFERGDRIDLSQVDADAVGAGDQSFHVGGTPGRTGDIVVSYDSDNDRTVVSLFVDGDRRADAVIELAGNIPLTANDFVL